MNNPSHYALVLGATLVAVAIATAYVAIIGVTQ